MCCIVYIKCSTLLAIKERQIKTTINCHCIVIKMAKMIKKEIPNIDKGVEQLKLSQTYGRNVNWYNHLGKWFGSLLNS